jgi:hypothetical protein
MANLKKLVRVTLRTAHLLARARPALIVPPVPKELSQAESWLLKDLGVRVVDGALKLDVEQRPAKLKEKIR